MNEAGITQAPQIPVEAVLRDELAHGDIVLGTIGPILGHLLANHDHSLFSDEIIARVRGMLLHVARQLFEAQGGAEGFENPHAFALEQAPVLGDRIAADPAFLAHCHALALEWQLAGRLQRRNQIDPVLSPLLQALIASDDATTASNAMALLAAQARFVQQQRRMELPLGELPADLFHHALVTWRELASEEGSEKAEKAERQLRETFDESAGRLGLLARVVNGMGQGALAALAMGHAGAAIFLTALAMASDQERDLTVVATNDRQLARLALSLRAAGLKPKDVEEQFQYIHPEVALPEGFDMLRADRAAAMLRASGGTLLG